MVRLLITIIMVVWNISFAYAEEVDFFIDFGSCKTTVGYLVLSDESIKTMDGDPTIMACFRRGENIACKFIFKNGADGVKGNTENYKVLLDSPPYMYLESANGSTFIAIHTVNHAAVMTVRVLAEQFSGSKICHGLYTTGSEMKTLK